MREKINELIVRMKEQNSFPAVSQYIGEINSKASANSNATVEEVANIILKDFSLTSKLLKVANSATFGQFSGTISTVSRAIVILGFEQVRLTAAGLIFFESLQGNTLTPRIKEGVLASFLSGIIARDLAKNVRLKDWENYYIGAMFHNFGRLLAIHYFPEEFNTYLKLCDEDVNDKLAALRALGVTFTDLGVGVARFWGLPDQIIQSIKPPAEKDLESKPQSLSHHQLIPLLANEICDITMNAPEEEMRLKLAKVLAKYRKVYTLDLKQVLAVVENAADEMKAFASVLRFSPTDIQRIKDRSSQTPHPDNQQKKVDQEQDPAASLEKYAVSSGELQSSLPLPEQRKQQLQNGMQDISNLMLDEFTLDDMLGKILETIYQGIGFDRVVIFFKNPRSGQMQARYALGQHAATITKNVSFIPNPEADDVFNIALFKNKDLYIHDVNAPDLTTSQPDWFGDEIFSPSFVILPIIINKVEIGLIYGGHNKVGNHLTLEQLNALRTLRNQSALAIKQVFSNN